MVTELTVTRGTMKWRKAAQWILLLAIARPAAAETPQAPAKDLTSASMEDLMNMEVTSVSKKEQKGSRTAAAIFVITSEDLQRSGATNIPDLLRMVPGLDVGQINANTWAISARGLNSKFSNELLVLVDGRNVYTPTFGGVFWDVLDVPMEDIQRIEVIRGPGGSIWGANAVNGVINIITKKTGETKGATVVAGGGNLDQGFGTVQYGGQAGASTDYRVYSKYLNQDHMPGLSGQRGQDGWNLLRAGFRTDSAVGAKDSLMFQGDMYTGRESEPTTTLASITSPALTETMIPVNLSGGFFQGVWNHAYSQRSDSTLMVAYDTYEREDQLGETRNTVDVDFQHHIAWGSRQDFVWGLEYRHSVSDTQGGLFVSLHPSHVDEQWFSSFVQDEITVINERLYLTAGTKLQHSYYSGFAVMPSARMTYALNEHHMVWTAISHAVRTPSDIDASIRLNIAGFSGRGGTPVLIATLGNPNFKNEGLVAYELGYRTRVRENLSIDCAAYYNDYSNQQTTEPATPFFEVTPAPAHLVLPSTYQNLEKAEGHGLEIAANWKVNERWSISPGYDFERIHARTSTLSQDQESPLNDEGSDPHVQAQVRSQVQIWKNLIWNTSAFFVDRVTFDKVPSYTRLDTGLSWRWKENVSLSLVGQNLLRDHHLEFIDSTGASRSNLIKRSAYAKFTWQF